VCPETAGVQIVDSFLYILKMTKNDNSKMTVGFGVTVAKQNFKYKPQKLKFKRNLWQILLSSSVFDLQSIGIC